MLLPTFTTLGAGPTVLMLHGLMGSHLSFAPQVESLASAGYRAVAWDMPGYGRSAPIEPYTFKGLAQRCVALIEGLKCGTVCLIGHDIGGMVAQEVVARRPELVDRLVLCGTTARAGAATGAIAQASAEIGDGAAMQELAQRLVPRLVGPGSLPEGVRLAQVCMEQVNPSTWLRAADALAGFDRTASLAQIRMPTLVLAGELDRQAPAAQMLQMSRQIASSTYVELPGIGHLPNLEAPDEFDAAVLNFLALPRLLH